MASRGESTRAIVDTRAAPSKTPLQVSVFGHVCLFIGVILSYTSPLHVLSTSNQSDRSYYWNRVTSDTFDYNYSDGADYQTNVCFYAGNVLVAFMTITLVSTVCALFFVVSSNSEAFKKDATRLQAVFSALSAITYTLSLINWASSCLNLTRVNNESTIQGQSVSASIFIVMVVFDACGLIGAYASWKHHQQSHPLK